MKNFLKPTLLKVIICLLLIAGSMLTLYLYKENLEPAQGVLLAKGEQVTINPVADFLYLVFVTIPVKTAVFMPDMLSALLGDSVSLIHFPFYCFVFILQSYLLVCVCLYIVHRLKSKE